MIIDIIEALRCVGIAAKEVEINLDELISLISIK